MSALPDSSLPRKGIQKATALLATSWAVLSDYARRLVDPPGNFFKLSEELNELLPLVANTWSEEWVLRRVLYLQQRGLQRKGDWVQTGWTLPVRTDSARGELKSQTYWRWPKRWEDRMRQVAVENLTKSGALQAVSWEHALAGWTDEEGRKQEPLITREEAGPKTDIYLYRCNLDQWPAIAKANEEKIRESREARRDKPKSEPDEPSDDAGPSFANRPAVLPVLPKVKFQPGRATSLDLPKQVRSELGFDKVRVNVQGAPATVDFTLRKNLFDCTIVLDAPPQSSAGVVPQHNGNGNHGTKVPPPQSIAGEMRLGSVKEIGLRIEFPKAVAAICRISPTTQPIFARGITERCVKVYANVPHPKIPLSDDLLEAAVQRAHRDKPDARGKLLETLVPQVVANWAAHGTQAENISRAEAAMIRDLEAIYGPDSA